MNFLGLLRWAYGRTASPAARSAILATVSELLLVTMGHYLTPYKTTRKTKILCSIQSMTVPYYLYYLRADSVLTPGDFP